MKKECFRISFATFTMQWLQKAENKKNSIVHLKNNLKLLQKKANTYFY